MFYKTWKNIENFEILMRIEFWEIIFTHFIKFYLKFQVVLQIFKNTIGKILTNIIILVFFANLKNFKKFLKH